VLAALGAFALVGAMATFIWLERRKKKAEIEVSFKGLCISLIYANQWAHHLIPPALQNILYRPSPSPVYLPKNELPSSLHKTMPMPIRGTSFQPR
jgi:hypothetical protein